MPLSPLQAVDLHVFDLHTTSLPLTFNECLQEKFRFLAQPAPYQEQYASGKSILTDSFDIHPLSKHAQTRNHFWNNYLSRSGASTIDYWKLQAPFVGSLRQPIVSLAENPNFQGRITPKVYLSALGWSSSLDIHLRGDIQLRDLLDFILGIIGKALDPASGKSIGSPLRLNGNPAQLSLIFSNLGNRLLKEVYDPAHPPKTGAPQISRHFIVSLSKFPGPPSHYQRTLSTKGMTSAEQALMHSLLRGEMIAVKELRQKLRKLSPTFVDFGSGPDFMLVYFDYGALLFLQESAQRKDRRQRALSCVASNIRSSAITIWTMFHFYLATHDASNEAVKDLREMVRSNLSAMKDRYLATAETLRGSGKYAKAFFKNHETMKRLLAKSG